MRLLSLNGDDDLVWQEFSQDETPPYAILSHTWDADEVSFSDLIDGSGSKKAGYRKIVFCGQQAARHGLRYFWVDTCTIDKWNNREREMSVNSMFDWYKNAARCYVYLTDVSVISARDARQQSSWEASFRASRWFTRGWTLQELIAPVSVEFFSKEEQGLGDKSTLEQLIYEVTRIPIAVLRGCSLDDFSTSERLGWAADRDTTYPEDGAYCLLGIVGVKLSLTYGEGREKALCRLREALEANKMPWIVPYSRNERFVGRHAQLAELDAMLFSGKETMKIAILGPGGAGKSQLALELAYRTRQARNSCCILWIDASHEDSLLQAYARIARQLDIAGWEEEQADVQRLVHEHFDKTAAGEWLLIFDNADDANAKSEGEHTLWMANLISSLPQSELGSIVFTTINSAVADILAPQRVIELGGISSDSGQEMLQRYLPSLVISQEQEQVELLLAELSTLPLPIVHAAAYIKTTETTIIEYRSLLHETRKAFTSYDGESDGFSDPSTDDPIATTWLISFEQLRRTHPTAANYLCFIACMEPKDVPLELLDSTSTKEVDEAMGILGAYALVTRRPAESALDIHRLVHHATRGWLRKHQLLGQWSQKAAARLDHVFPNDDHRNRHKWRRLLPHAQTTLSHVPDHSHDAANIVTTRLMSKCVTALYHDGRWDEAEALQVQVMETRKTKLGVDHPHTLISIANLASIYRHQGRWDEAEALQVQAMETSKTQLGAEHPHTLANMANLALIYWNQGRWDEAEALQVQVVEISKTKSADHPNILDSIANLASTYRNQGRWDEAEVLQVQVMETSKTKLGADHPHTLVSLYNLAYTWKHQGYDAAAVKLLGECVKLRSCKLGANHPDTLRSISTLDTWQLETKESS